MKFDWRALPTTAIALLLTGASCISFSPFKPGAKPCIDSSRSGGTATAAASGGEPVVSVQSGHSTALYRMQITPDGQYAVAAEQSPARVKLWHIETGREVLTYPLAEQSLWGMNLSSDGKRVLVDYPNRGIQVFDLMTGTELQRCFDEVGLSVRSPIGRYSADGKHVSAWKYGLGKGESSFVEIWDLDSGNKTASFVGHMAVVPQFSPKGDALLFAGDEHTAQLADVNSATLVRSFTVKADVSAVAFSWDGQTVYVVDKNGLLFAFDRTTGASRGEPTPLLDGKFVMTMLPMNDGKRFVVGDFDGNLGTFNLESKQWAHFASAGRPAAALSPDGTRLFVGTPGQYFVWRLADGTPQATWKPESDDRTLQAFFLPDGKHVAVIRRDRLQHRVELLDLEQKKTLWKGPDVEMTWSSANLSATIDGRFVLGTFVKMSPDAMLHQSFTQVFDASSGQLLQTIALGGMAQQVWESPAIGLADGKLAIARREGTGKDVIHILDAATGRTLWQQEPHITLFDLSGSPDGRRLILSGLQVTQVEEESKVTHGIWSLDLEARTVRLESEMSVKDASLVVQRVFAGPHRQFVVGGQSFGKMQGMQLGRMIQFFELHPENGAPKRIADQQLRWASFTGDGARMLWVGDDGFVHLASATTGEEILRIASFDDGEWVIMNPAGFFAASQKGAQYLSVRSGNQFFAIDQFYERLYRPDVVLASLTGKAEGAAPTVNLAQVLQAGPPPSVRMVSPAPGEQAKRDVEIEVELTDGGGGFGRIEWRINGAVIGIAGERGIKAKSKAREQRKETKVITLSPGENRIEVVAFNAEGTASSAPAVLTLTMKDEISEPPALYVLGVAVNKYRDRTLQLSYAVPDAQSLSESFQKVAGNVFTRVEAKLVTDADATATGIAAAFGELAAKVKSNDVFVLFIAGHGVTMEGRYHFLPSDFRYQNEESVKEKGINQDDLQKWMSSIQAKKSLVLLDTCNSGSFVQAQAVSRGIQEKTAIDKLTRATGRATIAASTDTQVALEGLEGHGVFTFAVMDALLKADSEFGNKDGVVTTGELAAFINEKVPDLTYKKWGYEQVPQVNLHGREFPIGVAAAK